MFKLCIRNLKFEIRTHLIFSDAMFGQLNDRKIPLANGFLYFIESNTDWYFAFNTIIECICVVIVRTITIIDCCR